jgi:hypothetical protein
MSSLKQKIIIIWLLLCFAPVFGQSFPRGAILDPVQYERVDAKPVLVSRNYASLPRSVSLKQYSPIPGNQGLYMTCVGWSTAFTARTISESIAMNRTSRTLSSENVFSPTHIYKNISDNEGKKGAVISYALDFMKETGIAKRDPVETPRATTAFETIPLSTFNSAKRYTISGYTRLFSNWRGVPGSISERVPPVKKSLSEGRPVLIGMNCPESFNYAKDIWQPNESEYIDHGGHAMCVVGYDDDKHGGAFEIQNSWGTSWGNEGYIWIGYKTFADFVDEAYEVIENLANYTDSVRFAASIEITVSNDSRGMPVTFDRQGFYKTRLTYSEGTRFQFQMTNKQPAYVYAFSMDDTSAVLERVFPTHGTSPVLDYKDSTVAWPSEYEAMELSGPADTDYLIVLYAKEALDIGAIEKRFFSEMGSFPQRVERAVGSNFIPYNDVQYNNNRIEFSTQTQNPKAVLGLLLAIDRQ